MLQILIPLILSFNVWAIEPGSCELQFQKSTSGYTDALRRDLTDPDPYKPVLSTDTTYIETVARIDKEKSFPQRNMRMAEKADRYWVDADYEAHNLYRRSVYQADSEQVYGQLKGQEKQVNKAGREILKHLLEVLPSKYPERFFADGKKLYDKTTKEVWNTASRKHDPLVLAGLILGEDLILLDEETQGNFRMVGGFLANPSSWSLKKHLGNDLKKIHKGENPRVVKIIETAVANLKAKDMTSLRNGWQFTEFPHYGQFPYVDQTMEETTGRITRANIGERVHLRSEMQTISLLPQSGLMLFTIKVFQYNLEAASRNPEIARSLINGVKMNIEQDHYDFPHPKLILEYLQQRAE